MIKFVIQSDCFQKSIPHKYPELITCEVYLCILINNEVYFEDPFFSIHEFLFFIDKWKHMHDCSFIYNSIETEDNPLLCFNYSNGRYSIKSTWELFRCDITYTKTELLDALQSGLDNWQKTS